MVDLSIKSLKNLSKKVGKNYVIGCCKCNTTTEYQPTDVPDSYVVISTRYGNYALCKSCLQELYNECDGNIFAVGEFLDKKCQRNQND